MTTTYESTRYCASNPPVLRCAPRDEIGTRPRLTGITTAAPRRASPSLQSPTRFARTGAAHAVAAVRCAPSHVREGPEGPMGRILERRRRALLYALRSRRWE